MTLWPTYSKTNKIQRLKLHWSKLKISAKPNNTYIRIYHRWGQDLPPCRSKQWRWVMDGRDRERVGVSLRDAGTEVTWVIDREREREKDNQKWSIWSCTAIPQQHLDTRIKSRKAVWRHAEKNPKSCSDIKINKYINK